MEFEFFKEKCSQKHHKKTLYIYGGIISHSSIWNLTIEYQYLSNITLLDERGIECAKTSFEWAINIQVQNLWIYKFATTPAADNDTPAQPQLEREKTVASNGGSLAITSRTCNSCATILVSWDIEKNLSAGKKIRFKNLLCSRLVPRGHPLGWDIKK